MPQTFGNFLSSRINAMEFAFSDRVFQIQTPLNLSLCNETGAVEQQLTTNFQAHQGWNDILNSLQQIEVAKMRISSLEERLDALSPSPSSSLLSSRLDRFLCSKPAA
mmetsp:Transcript_24478/g.42011  ORF Transcript_24478/g.42011 Transcript_24478/m.42011 type:complete len:107 (-) Transcript_24478:47-367(-)